MKFSIVIPLYNKQHSIRRALYSALDQTSDVDFSYEIIVIDDGSSDRSLAIVKSIQAQHPNGKIKVHSQKNAGVSAARNKGIELATAEHIAFLDADDTYHANFLCEINRLITTYPAAAMFATAYCFIDSRAGRRRDARIVGLKPGEVHQTLDDFFYSAARGDLPVTSSSVCICKHALESLGGFPDGENMGEDQAVWSQMALKHPIAISQRVCANYFEDTGSSLMQTVAPRGEMPFSKRLQQQLEENQVPGNLTASLKKYIAGHLLDLVRRNIQTGDTKRAQKLVFDPRARRQLRRWAYWLVRVTVARCLAVSIQLNR